MGIIKGFLSFLLVTILLVASAVYYFVLAGPQDLGIKYDSSDFEKISQSSGVITQESPVIGSVGQSLSFEGYHHHESVITSAEASAMINSSPYKYFPFSKVQMKFNPDGSVEGSGLVDINNLIALTKATGGTKYDLNKIKDYLMIPNIALPVYLKAEGLIANNQPNLKWQAVQVGKINVPVDLVNQYSKQIGDFITERIIGCKGLFVKEISVEDSKLKFVGTLPDTITVQAR